jgi:hypothetical protein
MATIVAINRSNDSNHFSQATRVSKNKSESGSYMHHFHKVWWQLAFYRILKYVF